MNIKVPLGHSVEITDIYTRIGSGSLSFVIFESIWIEFWTIFVLFVLFELFELFEYFVKNYSIFELQVFLLELETLGKTNLFYVNAF